MRLLLVTQRVIRLLMCDVTVCGQKVALGRIHRW